MLEHMSLPIAIIITDGLQWYLIGILKTLQIKYIWKLQFIGQYFIGLGSSILLSLYLEHELTGLLLGWLIGSFFNVIFMIRIINKLDWPEIFVHIQAKFQTIKEDIRKSTIQLQTPPL